MALASPRRNDTGADSALLEARTKVYEKARKSNPVRWSKQVRNWHFVHTVHVNPDTSQHKEPHHLKKAA